MKTIIFCSSYWNALSLFDQAKRLEAYDAIMAYAFTGEMKKVSRECAPAVSLICSSIEFDYSKYEAARERTMSNGQE